MSHIRFDPTHEPEPTSHSHFQMPRVWQKSHQDAEALPLNEPIDREIGSQSSLSVIVPAKNEASSLPRLVSEIILALRPLCTMSSKPIPRRLSRFEIIVVDDGSTDSTSLVLTELAETYPELRSLRLRAPVGQSAAIVAGFRAARGDWLATLDADLQNDPTDLITLWNALPGHDVALGWRVRRVDAWLKRLVSHLANQVSKPGPGPVGLRHRLLRANFPPRSGFAFTALPGGAPVLRTALLARGVSCHSGTGESPAAGSRPFALQPLEPIAPSDRRSCWGCLATAPAFILPDAKRRRRGPGTYPFKKTKLPKR